VQGWEVMVVTAVAGRKADGVGVAGGEPQAGAQRVTLTGRSSRSIEVARRGVCRLQRSWSNQRGREVMVLDFTTQYHQY